MSAHYVRSFQNKHLLEIFPFLNSNFRKMGNMRTGTEIANPCINAMNKLIFLTGQFSVEMLLFQLYYSQLKKRYSIF